MVPSHEQVRTAFDFLLSRGYTFVAEHAVAMAGTIVFRRPHIWLNVEWDRSEPWITFTFTGVGPEPVMWTEVDRALMGHTHPEYGPDNPTAPLSTLVAFLHTCLPSLVSVLKRPDGDGCGER